MSDPFRATQLAHDWVRPRLRPGDHAIDATAGNGHDTLFLAERVGPGGRVLAFDVDPAALAAARALLAEHGLASRVVLVQADHQDLETLVPFPAGSVRAIMFNLGFLPQGDKTRITLAPGTLAALQGALRLLAPGGLITLVCYPEHAGGGDEARAVMRFCEALDPAQFRALRCHVLNFARTPPFVIGIEKRR